LSRQLNAKNGERKEAHRVEDLLEEEFVCSSLVCKERPGFSVPPNNRASTIIACMEDLDNTNGKRPSLFLYFDFPFPSQKRWQAFLHDPKDAMFLSFHPTYIYIHNVVLTVSQQDPGR
jgi:hypothetical protein